MTPITFVMRDMGVLAFLAFFSMTALFMYMIIRTIPRKNISALRNMKIMHMTVRKDKEAITDYIPACRAEGKKISNCCSR